MAAVVSIPARCAAVVVTSSVTNKYINFIEEPSELAMPTHCCFYVGPTFTTLAQHQTNSGATYHAYCDN